MEEIIKYFKELTPRQIEQFTNLLPLYAEWNDRINVISRKDIENIYLHHVLHSLSIGRLLTFPENTTVLDVGTGGGFPGIPLAILFPKVKFTLCDSIGKKIKVAQGVADALKLSNVTTVNSRVEAIDGRFDYVVSRAVTRLSEFYPWVKGKYINSIIYLKGGDLSDEIAECVKINKLDRALISEHYIGEWFEEEYFAEKKIIIITR
ncbi:MAG: 16S rRNA (guanine(527)-N(7))-methyltransferase RsmG [Bacteroidales bacterium]|nr:16S rRNA (guanine(527)-N(7))-methyltransferase RsmG [Bacteroidales bacterium]MDD4670803.1 16S rRNA (guanine(527)-N(7))-methyltransferase RsmG [Bacteroidales bacterium]